MIRNFDTILDNSAAVTVKVMERATIHEQIKITPAAPIPSRTDLLTEEVTWRTLRDYVVEQMLKAIGPFPRKEQMIEASIFKSFLKRWDGQAMAIARHAFEDRGGWWAGAPVRIESFCVNSDPYFAQPISEILARVASTDQEMGWK